MAKYNVTHSCGCDEEGEGKNLILDNANGEFVACPDCAEVLLAPETCDPVAPAEDTGKRTDKSCECTACNQ